MVKDTGQGPEPRSAPFCVNGGELSNLPQSFSMLVKQANGNTYLVRRLWEGNSEHGVLARGSTQ